MNRFGKRVDRLLKLTHTFVTGHEWKLLANDWKEPLDEAGVKSEDFKTECAEFREMLSKIDPENDKDKFETALKDFAKNNVLAYYAYMYEGAIAVSQAYSRGNWTRNEYTGFLRRINEARN